MAVIAQSNVGYSLPTNHYHIAPALKKNTTICRFKRRSQEDATKTRCLVTHDLNTRMQEIGKIAPRLYKRINFSGTWKSSWVATKLQLICSYCG